MRGGGKRGEKREKIPKKKSKKQTASWISLSLVYSSFGASAMYYPGPCFDIFSVTMAMEFFVKKKEIFQFPVL